MESLQQTAQRVLGALLHDQPLTAGKVAFAWQIVAGPALVRHTTLKWSGDGVLEVTATNDAWRGEVERAYPIVFPRLRQLLGPDAVTRIIATSPDARTRKKQRGDK
jgi:hypothetical protein